MTHWLVTLESIKVQNWQLDNTIKKLSAKIFIMLWYMTQLRNHIGFSSFCSMINCQSTDSTKFPLPPIYGTLTQHNFSYLDYLKVLIFLQIKHQQRSRQWIALEMLNLGNQLHSRTHWPILSYKALSKKESDNEKHGLLDTAGLALRCRLQL